MLRAALLLLMLVLLTTSGCSQGTRREERRPVGGWDANPVLQRAAAELLTAAEADTLDMSVFETPVGRLWLHSHSWLFAKLSPSQLSADGRLLATVVMGDFQATVDVSEAARARAAERWRAWVRQIGASKSPGDRAVMDTVLNTRSVFRQIRREAKDVPVAMWAVACSEAIENEADQFLRPRGFKLGGQWPSFP